MLIYPSMTTKQKERFSADTSELINLAVLLRAKLDDIVSRHDVGPRRDINTVIGVLKLMREAFDRR